MFFDEVIIDYVFDQVIGICVLIKLDFRRCVI
jgi:hypothetical protein